VDGVTLPFRSGPSEDIQDMAEYLVDVDVRLGMLLAPDEHRGGESDQSSRGGTSIPLPPGISKRVSHQTQTLSKNKAMALICEGESDTWTALSYSFAAVGSPGARNFKAAWVEGFRGLQDAKGRSRVYLVLDADKAGAEGSRVIGPSTCTAASPYIPVFSGRRSTRRSPPLIFSVPTRR
jgi:hypothetical protein